MTNEQKYKTAEERYNAYIKYCGSRQCEVCALRDKRSEALTCAFDWLSLEAEDEKPEPCPFCGRDTGTMARHFAGGFCVACECGYTSLFRETGAEAIAAHNRVARAVRAAKESEVSNG